MGINLLLTLASDYKPVFSAYVIPIGDSGSAESAITITSSTDNPLDLG